MEAEGAEDIKAVVLLEIQHVYMHRLLNKQKTLFTSGTCKIAKLENSRSGPVHFINLNSFYYGIQHSIHFVKVVYSDTIAYVFPHFENGLSSISIPPIPELAGVLDTILSQTARLVDPRQAMEIPELKALIDQHYPNLEQEQIYYPDNIKKYIATTGNFLNKAFTTIGGFVKTGVQKCGNFIDSKISQGEPTQVSDSTKEKWNKLKQNTNNIIHISSEYAGKILNPIVAKTKEYSHQIQEKVNHSDNNTIKYFKELAQVSGKAIGNAFDGLVKGGSEVTKELGAQGKKIITKKYGDEVIKTLSGENKEAEKKEEEKEKEGEPKKEEKKEGQKMEEGDSSVRLKEESSENLYPDIEK